MTTPILSGLSFTNWSQYGLADIWDMVKNEDGANTSGHVRAWAIMNELCDGQAKRLNAAATELATHWPPERSPAADIFISRLRNMAHIFTEAAAAAGRNSGAIQNLTTGLLETRGRVKELRETWRHWEGQEAKRVAATRKLLHTAYPIPSSLRDEDLLVASNIEPAKTLVDLTGAPDVATNWRSQLDQDARNLMRQSDRDINETRSRIQQPPVIAETRDDAAVWPPPPGPNRPGSDPSGGRASGSGSRGIPAPTFAPPLGNPARTPWEPGSNGIGDAPVLSGVGTTPQGPDASPSFIQGGPTTSMTSGVLGLMPGGILGLGPSRTSSAGSVLRPDGMGSGGGPQDVVAQTNRFGSTTEKALQPGFVSSPGGHLGSRPATDRVGGGRVASGGRLRRRNDPPDEWAPDPGVPGIIQPRDEADTHDPGPGVLGIDR